MIVIMWFLKEITSYELPPSIASLSLADNQLSGPLTLTAASWPALRKREFVAHLFRLALLTDANFSPCVEMN